MLAVVDPEQLAFGFPLDRLDPLYLAAVDTTVLALAELGFDERTQSAARRMLEAGEQLGGTYVTWWRCRGRARCAMVQPTRESLADMVELRPGMKGKIRYRTLGSML